MDDRGDIFRIQATNHQSMIRVPLRSFTVSAHFANALPVSTYPGKVEVATEPKQAHARARVFFSLSFRERFRKVTVAGVCFWSSTGVTRNECSLPVKLTAGWNRLCIDLREVCLAAFGVDYQATRTLRIYANCRVWRLYFAAADYADPQLPLWLRVTESAAA